MTAKLQNLVHQAMRLMQQGDLMAATRALQDALQSDRSIDRGPAAWARPFAPVDLEGEFAVVSERATDSDSATARARRRDDFAGAFSQKRFACEAGTLDYKLFIPDALPEGTAPPLLLMLHGCTQTPDDFARGTRMNALAQQHGYVVAYPAQAQGNNPGKCWNWFRAQDQQRDRGEAALLAELARHLVNAHGLDERRVYAAGLSAGGAMAAVLGHTYPDVFSAIGVHSGLPFGVAHDLPTALAAMKQGGRLRREPPPGTIAMPAIVFHGDADSTVEVGNGRAVSAQLAGHPERVDGVDARRVTVEKGAVSGGRAYTRTIFSDAAGLPCGEQWIVHGAGHAWSGGDRRGSYTDPSGPDASAEMIRFFAESARPNLN